MMAPELAPLTHLAQLINGTVHDERIKAPTGTIYAGWNGKVRIDLRGHILDLGTISDGPVALAESYRRVVAERGAA